MARKVQIQKPKESSFSRSRKDALLALQEAIRAADPRAILKNSVSLKGKILTINSSQFDLSRFDRVLVIGGGKAAAGMALAIEEILGSEISAGIVNIPDYLKPWPRSRLIEFHKASHPIPSAEGVDGVRKMLDLVGMSSHRDLVIIIISGGASSLLTLPLKPLTLSDIQTVTNLLLRSGAEIDEINTVRKHISSVKGGRLAQALYPATVVSLIISDVVGDRLESIASGPTVPDSTTYSDSKRILEKYRLWGKVPKRVRNEVNLGLRDKSLDTPKPGSKLFENVFNILVGTNKHSCIAAEQRLKKLGYKTLILSTHIRGEAKDVGKVFSGILKDIRSNGFPLATPCAIVAGGETTVTISGSGKGGRNQELVLSASLGIEKIPNVVVGSMGTDGIDGPTDAAGAIADGETIGRAKQLGLDAASFLKDHNSYNFFKKLGDLIITGPSGTNVNDIMILLAGKNPLLKKNR